MMLRNQAVIISLTLMLVMVGCKGGGSPTVPNAPDNGLRQGASPSASNSRGPGETHHLLTIVQVKIDASKKTIDVSPLRTASQHLNLLELIPIYCKPATSCLNFINLNINPATNTCDLDVVVHHPIPDAYTDVYDMRGIGIFKGTIDPGFQGGKVATQILNADGWTTAYDEGGAYDAFLNPYIAFNKDLPKRIFAHGTATQEHFTVKFPSLNPDDAQFDYALDASWYDPTLVDPNNPATDPNLPEPYEVSVLYTDPVADKVLSQGTAVVEIRDWQSNASTVTLECPDLMPAPFNMTQVYESGGRYLFYGNFVNDKTAAAASYPFLVKATDQFDTQPDLGNPTITVALTNYQLKNVKVYPSASNTAPVASSTASDLNIKIGQSVHFDATGSHDAEDTTLSYAWDFDGSLTFTGGSGAVIDHEFDTAAISR